MPSAFPRSTSLLPSFLTPLLPFQALQGDGARTAPLCQSFLLILFSRSSIGPSLGLQLLMVNLLQNVLSRGFLQGMFTCLIMVSLGAAGDPYWGFWVTSSPSTFSLEAVSWTFLLTLHCQALFCPSSHRLSRGSTTVAVGFKCALQWDCQSHFKSTVSSPHRRCPPLPSCQCLGTCTWYKNGHFWFVKAKTLQSFYLLHFPLEKLPWRDQYVNKFYRNFTMRSRS